MRKVLSLALLTTAAFLTTPASAATIFGSFSLTSFGGSYVGASGTVTALTATGLDFGSVSGSSGNGYGTNGTALVGNGTGSFSQLNGTFASIADISLGTLFANPFDSNPFISFGANSPITLNFSNATYTRSLFGTSVTINGIASFMDGVAADASTGIFSLSVNSQQGSPTSTNFTFTSNASSLATPGAVPEPATWAMMLVGFGGIGFAMRRRAKVRTTVAFA